MIRAQNLFSLRELRCVIAALIVANLFLVADARPDARGPSGVNVGAALRGRPFFEEHAFEPTDGHGGPPLHLCLRCRSFRCPFVLSNGLRLFEQRVGAERFEIDPAHAFVTFTVSHFSGKAKGSFTDVSGVITYDEKDITKSSVEVVIKTASIHTGNANRDNHLRSADFFDVQKFPEMTFKSKRVEKRGAGYVAVGDLTVRGVTKEVVMPFTLTGPIKDPLPSGVKRLLVESSLKVDRRDFGITWSRVMQDGGLFVGNEVNLEINVEAIVPKPKPTQP